MATRALTGKLSGGSGNWLISQINPTRSSAVSPRPMMPPEQTEIPASRTFSIVVSRSSYDRVVMTCRDTIKNGRHEGAVVRLPLDKILSRCRDCDCMPSSQLLSTVELVRHPTFPKSYKLPFPFLCHGVCIRPKTCPSEAVITPNFLDHF